MNVNNYMLQNVTTALLVALFTCAIYTLSHCQCLHSIHFTYTHDEQFLFLSLHYSFFSILPLLLLFIFIILVLLILYFCCCWTHLAQSSHQRQWIKFNWFILILIHHPTWSNTAEWGSLSSGESHQLWRCFCSRRLHTHIIAAWSQNPRWEHAVKIAPPSWQQRPNATCHPLALIGLALVPTVISCHSKQQLHLFTLLWERWQQERRWQ